LALPGLRQPSWFRDRRRRGGKRRRHRLKTGKRLRGCSIVLKAMVSAPSSSRTPPASPASSSCELGIALLDKRGARLLTGSGDERRPTDVAPTGSRMPPPRDDPA
jgi:hypothetical protein